MKTTIKSLLLLMLLVPSLALAQSTISGTVSELENGFPLPGVNVIIKGSSYWNHHRFLRKVSIDCQ